MNKEDILEEIEELQDIIVEKMDMLSKYVDDEADMDTELEPVFEDLEIIVGNMNEQLDIFTAAM